jgi:hypothetical protein
MGRLKCLNASRSPTFCLELDLHVYNLLSCSNILSILFPIYVPSLDSNTKIEHTTKNIFLSQPNMLPSHLTREISDIYRAIWSSDE